jgi:glycyl-tRNA synthetase beta chain
MSQFILEIGMEEMPARFLPDLKQELSQLLASRLQEANVPFSHLQTFATPRRLVAWVDGLETNQAESQEIVTGPPASIAFDDDGGLTKAGTGFARSQKADVSELFVHQTDKGGYLAIQKRLGGARTVDLLPDIGQRVISSLPFPKKMRWEDSGFQFGRPIRWLLALFDEIVVPVRAGNCEAGRQTFGHRVHGPGPFEVDSAEAYFSIIRDTGHVILDIEERIEMIRQHGARQAEAKGGSVVWKDELLHEVANLAEYPKPVLGDFCSSYLELPKEVLLTSMESHQKSFGVEDGQGKLLPHFLCTLNLEPKDLDLVKRGWERVLKARLEDAMFFWRGDSKTSLEDWSQELFKVVFLGPLGSMGQKSERLQALCAALAGQLMPDGIENASRAGKLAKVDLVSEMVGEFGDLQGIMGGIYAGQKGENATVATAIAEQYLPSGPDSEVPQSTCGAILSIADKADNLTGCFGLNMIPSGAQDPYALRRQALGIVRILGEHGFRLSLNDLLARSQNSYAGVDWKISPQESLDKLMDFFAQRIKAYFVGQGYETRIVDAVLSAGMDDVCGLGLRLQALDAFSRESDFEQAVLTFKRADNIIRKQGDQAPEPLTGQFNHDQLTDEAERELAARLDELAPRWQAMWADEEFDQLFGLLRELRPVVDRFFDDVMVMTDDPQLRQNRLNLLQALVTRLADLADFAALQI